MEGLWGLPVSQQVGDVLREGGVSVCTCGQGQWTRGNRALQREFCPSRIVYINYQCAGLWASSELGSNANYG